MTMLQLPIYVYRAPVQVSHIVRIEACSSYCRIHFAHRPPLTVAKVLQWFEQYLVPAGFVRIHRSHLINPAYVQAEVPPRYRLLTLSTGAVVPVSRQQYRQVKSWLSCPERAAAVAA